MSQNHSSNSLCATERLEPTAERKRNTVESKCTAVEHARTPWGSCPSSDHDAQKHHLGPDVYVRSVPSKRHFASFVRVASLQSVF